MADTLQVITWSLDYTCPLRAEDTIRSPTRAYKSTDLARYVSKQHSNGFGLYGDVCVTGYCLASNTPRLPEPTLYPSSGFVVSNIFADLGGKEAIKDLCSKCPANKDEEGIAHCAGSFYEDPFSTKLDQQLAAIISRLQIRAEFFEWFSKTNPMWFGLWTTERMSREALILLTRVLQEKLVEDFDLSSKRKHKSTIESEKNEDLAAFVRAALRSIESGIPINVCMSPPGHADFGYLHTFPHCTVCKAPLPNFKKTDHETSHRCGVCNSRLSSTDILERLSVEELTSMSSYDLREQLGSDRFRAFAKQYLMARGMKETDAIEIVEKTELDEEERMNYWKSLQAPEPPKK